MRPDIIVRNKITKKTHLLDLKIPYDVYKNFERCRSENIIKYRDLAAEISRSKRQPVTLGTIIVGCLGSWDPQNDRDLKKLGLTSKQANLLADKLTESAIRESFHIYQEHIKCVPRFPNITNNNQ